MEDTKYYNQRYVEIKIENAVKAYDGYLKHLNEHEAIKQNINQITDMIAFEKDKKNLNQKIDNCLKQFPKILIDRLGIKKVE